VAVNAEILKINQRLLRLENAVAMLANQSFAVAGIEKTRARLPEVGELMYELQQRRIVAQQAREAAEHEAREAGARAAREAV
jgi:hypothetical protein